MNYDDRPSDRRSRLEGLGPRSGYSRSDQIRYDAQHERPANTGDKDVGSDSTPLKFLLIRDLKPSTTNEILARGLEKLYSGGDEHPGGALPCESIL